MNEDDHIIVKLYTSLPVKFELLCDISNPGIVIVF